MMIEYNVFANTYIDSVTLMSATPRLIKEHDLEDLIMLMGTEMNKEMIVAVGYENDEISSAQPSDLIICIKHDKDTSILQDIFQAITNKTPKVETQAKIFHRIEEVASNNNIAIISVPGEYAAYEAQQALDNGLHVMMFSDNVSVEDEVKLKEYAIKKDLLMMGPDCGTAIINGIGLCFANKVKEGSIGIVAASGTGLQEVTALIDSFGGGISQAIGVGGRDLSEAVGGAMMLHSIAALNEDPDTKIIALVSKPPASSVEKKIIAMLQKIKKPIVVCFLDGSKTGTEGHITYANRLADTAKIAVELSGKTVSFNNDLSDKELQLAKELHSHFSSSQTSIKGLFCGGTLTSEALSILREHVSPITSNIAKKPHEKMIDPLISNGHNLVDLGDDLFTKGRPHPMIEPTIRLERIITEAKNPETAVILLDFELGYGSHEDPVGITLETIKEVQKIAQKNNRHIVIVAYVLGTSGDFQGLQKSIEDLENIGVIVARSNAHASLLAGAIVKGGLQ